MSGADADHDELFAAIDGETTDPVERQESRTLYKALLARKDELKTEQALPVDGQLSEKILSEARNRSAQISASRGGTGHQAQARSASIPLWQYVAWVAAIAGLLLAIKYLV